MIKCTVLKYAEDPTIPFDSLVQQVELREERLGKYDHHN